MRHALTSAAASRRRRIERRNRRWFPDYVPAHQLYCALARSLTEPGASVLHLGGGRDSLGVAAELPGAGRVVCLDPDLGGLRRNPGRLRVGGEGERLPFGDQAFDLILAENVFEHLQRPRAVLAECRRCLRPGGRLVFMCPNRCGYTYLISAALPYGLHVRLRKIAMGVDKTDTFPTYYRLNSAARIGATARRAGLHLETVDSYVGWPTYWEFSDLLHRGFVLVHRIVQMLPPALHLTLLGSLRRD